MISHFYFVAVLNLILFFVFVSNLTLEKMSHEWWLFGWRLESLLVWPLFGPTNGFWTYPTWTPFFPRQPTPYPRFHQKGATVEAHRVARALRFPKQSVKPCESEHYYECPSRLRYPLNLMTWRFYIHIKKGTHIYVLCMCVSVYTLLPKGCIFHHYGI